METENDWVIETLLIEAHRIIHGHARWVVCNLCHPERGVVLSYPPQNLDAIDVNALVEIMTDKQIYALLNGNLGDKELQAITTLGVGGDRIKQQVLQKVFVEGFSSLIFRWLTLFDGVRDPQMVEATDICATWMGAIISGWSPGGEKLAEDGQLISDSDRSLENRLMDAYQDFQALISTETYALLKVENFEDDETVLKVLMLEAYCEIEIQSRQFIKDLQNPDTISMVYPLDETNCGLQEAEKLAIRALGLEDEFVQTTLQKVLADACYSVLSTWLKVFEWQHTPLNIPAGKRWRGADISVMGRRYSDMLHDAFYGAWHEYMRIISQPPKRPF